MTLRLSLVLIALLGLAAWLVGTAPARAHTPSTPSFYLDAEVTERGVAYDLTGRASILAPWAGLPADTPFPTDERAQRRVLDALLPALQAKGGVVIDGQPSQPESIELEYPEDLNDGDPVVYWKARFLYPASGRARRVDFTWTDLEHASFEGREEVPVLIKVGRQVSSRLLDRAEPSYTWHTEAQRLPRFALIPEVVPPPPATLDLPLLALVLLVLALVALPLLIKLRAPRGLVWGSPAMLAVAALVAWYVGAGVWTVHDPFVERIRVPGYEQAQQVFTTLQDSVYASFDAESEDDIYGLLQSSVDASLLDQLYGDVYESLILRDDGGAVAVVDEVERELVDPQLPEDRENAPLEFKVHTKWTVLCTVTHWYHRHKRLNSYDALYTVRHDGVSWKLAEVRVLDQRREDLQPDYGVGLEDAPPDQSGGDQSGGEKAGVDKTDENSGGDEKGGGTDDGDR